MSGYRTLLLQLRYLIDATKMVHWANGLSASQKNFMRANKKFLPVQTVS